MKAANETKLKEFDSSIEDAEQNLGETEVRDFMLKKAEYYCRIGEKVLTAWLCYGYVIQYMGFFCEFLFSEDNIPQRFLNFCEMKFVTNNLRHTSQSFSGNVSHIFNNMQVLQWTGPSLIVNMDIE